MEIGGLAARAQILARTGRDADAVHALRQVTEFYAQLPSQVTGDHASQWSWPEQRLHFVASEVHTHAGRVDLADKAQGAALALYPQSSFQGPTQIQAHRAAALINAGDITTAAHHLATVLDRLMPWQRADGLVQRSMVATLEQVPMQHRQLSPVRQARALLEAAPSRN